MSTKNENVLDDWESIDDTELNTKVKLLKKSTTNSSDNLNNSSSDCSKPFAAMILNDDDCLRTQYVPPEKTVKILKRPTNDKNNPSSADQKPKAPIKTLQQREQEYAEARLRILGAAKSAEDEQEEKAAAASPVATVTPIAPIVPPQNASRNNGSAFNTNQTNGFSNRVAVNGTVPVGNNNPRQHNRNYSPQQQYHQINNFQLSQQQQMAVYQVPPEIIRLPRGPDGTSAGFMLKR